MAKFRLNVLDILIIAVVICVLAAGTALFFKMNKTEASKGERTTVEFTVEVRDLTDEIAQSFKAAVGKEVVYGTTNTDRGTITEVVIEPYKRLGEDIINGKFYWDVYPERSQAKVTIRTELYETDATFKGDAEMVRVGMKMPFSGGGIASPDGFIIGLVKIPEVK